MANKRYDQFVVGSDTGEKIFLTANPSTGELGKIDLTELFSINSIRLQEAKGTNVTAANDLTLGLGGNLFVITGNTQINAITTANWQAGSSIAFVFTGTPTLKHNTAGGAGTATMLLAGAADFDAAAADCIYLKYDGTNWHEITRKLAASGKGNTVTADNGLSKNNAHNVQLGGTLLQNTSIATGGFFLTLTTSTASATPFIITSLNGGSGMISTAIGSAGSVGVGGNTDIGFGVQGYASGATGFGISGYVDGGAYPLDLTNLSSSTNTVLPMAYIHRETTGTAADGIGESLDFYLETDNTAVTLSNQIISKLTTAANATRTSQLDITGVNSAVTQTQASFKGTGQVQFNQYGSGTFTGTPTKTLQVDASGNIIEGAVSISGITADNGLTASTATNVQLGGTLLGNTIINTDLYSLTLSTATGGVIPLVATATTGIAVSASATSGLAVNASATTGVALKAASDGGTYGATIQGYANSSNISVPVLNIQSLFGGSAAGADFGGQIDFNLQTSNFATIRNSNSIKSFWTVATDGSRTSQLDITGVNSAATGTIASFYGSGVVGIGISSSYTATRLNVVDNAVGAASIVDITSTSTAAASNSQKGLNIALSGTNATSSQLTYAGYFSNTHDGTGSNNYGIYSTATGGTSINYAVYGKVTGGNIAIYGDDAGGNGWGVFAESATGVGVHGESSSSGYGVEGVSVTGFGVRGVQSGNGGIAVKAETSLAAAGTAYGIQSLATGAATDNIAAYFQATNATNNYAIIVPSGSGNVGIGTTTPSSAALLELSSTTQAFIVMRMTATQGSAITPAAGMIIFVTNTNGTFTSVGFWGYDGSAWAKF